MQPRVRFSFCLLCVRRCASARNPPLRAGTLKLRVAVSGFVCAFFTAALVLAQVPKDATPPGGTTVEQKVERVGKLDTKTTKTAAKQKAGPRDAAAAPAPPAKNAIRANVNLRAAGIGDAANRDNLIQQWTIQGQPMVRAELIFVRSVCRLDRDQFRQINRDAAKVLEEVVTKMVDGQIQPRMAIRKGQSAMENTDGAKLLRDALAALMKKDLSPDQWSRYQAELDKRLASRKPIAVVYLVNALDRELFLTDQQRATLTESLSSHWDDGWYIYLEYVLDGNQFFPMGIDPLVVPVLTDVQKKVWQGFQRVRVGWGFGGMHGGLTNDQDALEEELGEVKKAEPANPAFRRRAVVRGLAP